MSQELYDRERLYLATTAKAIRELASTTTYDHRRYIGKTWAAGKEIHTDAVEVPQGRLIYAIGKVLPIKRIYEVGIGPGITAHSLREAIGEDMQYCGVDSIDGAFLTEAVGETVANLKARGLKSTTVLYKDSDDLAEFKHPDGPIDLIHIDGAHDLDHQRRDVEKAIRSGADWLLVDDANDTIVLIAVFQAIHNELHKAWRGGLLPMIYFEDSRTGSVLFHIGMWKGQ